MPYFILVIGLVVIYFALRKNGRKADNNTNVSIPFNEIVQQKTDQSQMELLNNAVIELTLRVEDIENALVLLDEKINSIEKPQKKGKKETPIELVEEVKTEVKINEPVLKTVQEPQSQNMGKHKVNEKKADNDINNVIYNLYDQGKNIDDICSILNLGKGEVLLRLGLRKPNS